MTLAVLHIYTCLTEPSLCHTTKIKYAGLVDLFFTLNPAILDMLYIQIDDNYRSRHVDCIIMTQINNII